MITSIAVDGFKTLSNFSLTLHPGLNILVGPNGSGKTNIISFFEFLSHVIEKDPSEATSQLGGAGAVFRRVKDTHQWQIQAFVTGCYPIYVEENRDKKPARKPSSQAFAFYEYGFKILFSSELESVIFSSQQFRYKQTSRFISAAEHRNHSREWDLDLETILENDFTYKTKLRSFQGDLARFFPFVDGPGGASSQAQGFVSQILAGGAPVPSQLMRFAPALMPLAADMSGGQTYNIIPSRVKVLEDSSRPPGINSDGSGLSATLYSLRKRNVSGVEPFQGFFAPVRRSSLKRPSLEKLVGYFQLANTAIDTVDVSNDSFTNQIRVSFKIKNGDYIADVPLALMSDGTLKWLTLLTAALTASSVFSIEEPENYLHPRIQGQFVGIMRELLFTERAHACTLMTTHSETLLNHCRPGELIVVSLVDGKTVSLRCRDEEQVSDEISRTGFGLGYYYIAGAL